MANKFSKKTITKRYQFTHKSKLGVVIAIEILEFKIPAGTTESDIATKVGQEYCKWVARQYSGGFIEVQTKGKQS